MTHAVSPLDAARAEIDAIDDLLLDLIERRLAAARAIAAAKAEDGLLKLRPRRQAEVVTRLQRRERDVPAQAVRAVWRELMAHSLEAQAPMRLLVAPGTRPDLPEALRGAFGSAPALEHVASAVEALRRAEQEEAVAILPDLSADLPGALVPFQRLSDASGETIGIAVGRVAAREALGLGAWERRWSPASWRACKPSQLPLYPDAGALAEVEAGLAAAPGVVTSAGAMALKADLAMVAQGRGFLLQAGDCAESFEAFSAERIKADRALLLTMGQTIGGEVVHVARAAGQFAKPRSSALESRDGTTLPSYRGDAVNGSAFTHAARLADPRRLLRAHQQSRATAALLGAYDEADRLGSGGAARVWTSHEALLLPYEQALTRRDAETGRWWAQSGHMLWIGDRTRDPDGAHIRYAAGVANPIGLKCGPSLDADTLLRLIEELDPENEPGRLVMIGRFGAGSVQAHLPGLMRATRSAGRVAIWACDPMHGNGQTVGRRKVRRLDDIAAEAVAFLAIAAAEGVHAGGLHVETSGAAVTECLGAGVGERDLDRRYESLCDPRLNPDQALELARRIAAARKPAPALLCSAA